jgi:membrane-associated protease RseP (regulator of RpoE activity)
MEIGLDVIAVVAFFALIGVLLYVDRRNVEFSHGIALRRWKKGQYAMDKWIFSHRRFLEIVGTVGVVLGFLSAFFVVASILYATFVGEASVKPILPTVGDYRYPDGVMGVPFWFWIIAIFVVLTVHEPMHAIFARLAGVPVRSWGVMTFLVLPIGAFVDPDMKKVQKLRLMQKLKIFAAGSFGNFLAGGFFLLVMLVMGAVMFGQANVPGGPADLAGLDGKILKVDGTDIKYLQNLTTVLNSTPAGSTVQIATDKGSYDVVTAESKTGTGSYIGVTFGLKPEYQPWKDQISVFVQLMRWLVIFNIGIGLFNTIPMRPFDGGHVFEAVFAKVFKSDAMGRKAINATSLAILAIILFNVFSTSIFG